MKKLSINPEKLNTALHKLKKTADKMACANRKHQEALKEFLEEIQGIYQSIEENGNA